jgi:hypothetical protein
VRLTRRSSSERQVRLAGRDAKRCLPRRAREVAVAPS